jgi:hypothetical protein
VKRENKMRDGRELPAAVSRDLHSRFTHPASRSLPTPAFANKHFDGFIFDPVLFNSKKI